jgi:diguanylate cyclase (GGDEF)-like protein
MAETDALTGVANRRKAGQVLSRYLRLAERHHQPVAVAMLDLDHFKQVNDRHGHAAGDMVLRRLGQVLRSFRGEDVVARWGGEEFVVGMYGTTRAHAIHRLAEILEGLRGEEFAGADGQTFRISFSAGVAEYPTDGADLQALYRAADEALYRAKAAGRDRVLPANALDVTGGERPVDVAVVSEDTSAARALLRALDTRGYQTAWLSAMEAAERTAGGLSQQYNARVFLVDADRYPGVVDALMVSLQQSPILSPARRLVLIGQADTATGLPIDGQRIERLSKPLDHRVALQRIRRLLET